MTLLGIALTAWLLPAFTRQWDDRQKAHDLKAAITDDMATATASALFGGKTRYQAGPNGSLLAAVEPATEASLAAVIRRWELSSFQIEAKLRAYFDDAAVWKAWRKYSDGVRQFFLALTQPPAQRPRSVQDAALKIGLDPEQAAIISLRADMVKQAGDFYAAAARKEIAHSRKSQAAAALGTSGKRLVKLRGKRLAELRSLRAQAAAAQRKSAEEWSGVYATVEQQLLSNETRVSLAVLAAHPTGYSTSWHDLLRDLVH
jgi:hypothetical protein